MIQQRGWVLDASFYKKISEINKGRYEGVDILLNLIEYVPVVDLVTPGRRDCDVESRGARDRRIRQILKIYSTHPKDSAAIRQPGVSAWSALLEHIDDGEPPGLLSASSRYARR